MAQGGLREAGKKAAFWPTLAISRLAPKRKKGRGWQAHLQALHRGKPRPWWWKSLSQSRDEGMLQEGEDRPAALPQEQERKKDGALKAGQWLLRSTGQRSWQTLWAPAQGYSDAPLVFCWPCCRHALFSEQEGELGTASATAKQLSLAPTLPRALEIGP